MTLFDLLILLLVAGICGALGQAISGYSRGGCLVSIALGFVGAVLGVWLARSLGLPELLPVHIGTTSFSDCLVDHWFGTVCGGDRIANSPSLAKLQNARSEQANQYPAARIGAIR